MAVRQWQQALAGNQRQQLCVDGSAQIPDITHPPDRILGQNPFDIIVTDGQTDGKTCNVLRTGA